MPVISISLTKNLLKKIDEVMNKEGYSSRSEIIREAVRDFLSQFELTKFERGKVTATVTAISEHLTHDADERLMRLRHEFNDIVSANMHIHLGKIYCLEVFVTEGDVERIRAFISKIRSIRGIQQVKYTMVPLITETT